MDDVTDPDAEDLDDGSYNNSYALDIDLDAHRYFDLYQRSIFITGGTQSLHTNAFDEAIGLPTEFR